MIKSLKNNSRGEASLIFVFVILMIIVVSALTVSMMSVTTLKNSGVSENGAKAQFVVDSALEEALAQYAWKQECINVADFTGYSTDSSVKYKVETYSVNLDDGKIGGCPPSIDSGPTGTKLCIVVTADKNGVQKKYLSGPNPQCLK